ncbi:MAG: hypothetical protein ACD_66C00196G0002 [uncultured bacterium]|uniref:Uncharacterized protein n=1 Tax=Candidatus Uhrbacteria bacterium GW2011_GWC1_41_20 TaxID=1618983 RepID=A0A0G0VGC5_9BACT|nr:MAG: hypothetical protein ACD_66C00196G0002 [uncultured bacterium]KKR23168.1 MAG: hypothetical protein UT52_C0002G0040 [Candidatus Uhrbacteria bacterium GW2011_GWE1_39_46]KKR64523.1 MAG: hypothetical protein UU04_C0001G0040 [Candidatus Uhrbacteria bacterium GW2011_GWC2_40_450]KKR90595.1 MAG: hypothetical protein UU40_C0002G0040 [Candidatus Uhrbacteria bacterium GW2011_GWD2_41_121]KKR90811.1 MAG: hypothetical protein UU36_C0001G0016 [Candidatus Uhrbacteria bacterium GW2011_GWE2_41_1153]KKR96
MSVKQYILFLASGTALTACAWFIVLISINPVSSGVFGFLAFYVALFLALMGFFSTIATILRIIRKKHVTTEAMIKVSLRQGLLLAILFEGALILVSKGYLSIPLLLLLILIISIIEFIALSFETGSHKSS